MTEENNEKFKKNELTEHLSYYEDNYCLVFQQVDYNICTELVDEYFNRISSSIEYYQKVKQMQIVASEKEASKNKLKNKRQLQPTMHIMSYIGVAMNDYFKISNLN